MLYWPQITGHIIQYKVSYTRQNSTGKFRIRTRAFAKWVLIMYHYISHQSDILSRLMVGLHWLMVRSVEASARLAWVVRNVTEVWGRPLSVIYFLSSVYHSPLTVSVLTPVCLYVLRLGERIRVKKGRSLERKVKPYIGVRQFMPPNRPADDLPTLLIVASLLLLLLQWS